MKEESVQLLSGDGIIKKNNVLHWLILSFFCIILVCCNNATAKSQNLSEYELGRKFVDKLKDRYGVCEDSQIIDRVTTISNNILKVADPVNDLRIFTNSVSVL